MTGDDRITVVELGTGLSAMCQGGVDKARDVFNHYDLNNDGFLSRDELKRYFEATFKVHIDHSRPSLGANQSQCGEHAVPPPSPASPLALYSIIAFLLLHGLSALSPLTLSHRQVTAGLSEAGRAIAAGQDMSTLVANTVDEVMEAADLNQDGKLSFEEFQGWLEVEEGDVRAWTPGTADMMSPPGRHTPMHQLASPAASHPSTTMTGKVVGGSVTGAAEEGEVHQLRMATGLPRLSVEQVLAALKKHMTASRTLPRSEFFAGMYSIVQAHTGALRRYPS